MRTELRAIQQRVGITFIYITHDQGEALTMSDHVAVMREGIIEQVADGTTIYDSPETSFVASFVGENNVFQGKVSDLQGDVAIVDTGMGSMRARAVARQGQPQLHRGDDAMVFVRPESLEIIDANASSDNRVTGQVMRQEFEGNLWQVHVQIDNNGPLVTQSTMNDGRASAHAEGSTVSLGFSERLAVALPQGQLAAE